MNQDDVLKALKNEDYWKALNPHLHITDTLFENCDPDFSYDKTQLQEAGEDLNHEGYYKLDSVIDESISTALAQGIKNLSAHGILPIFAFVYDEYWLLLKRLESILRTSLGNHLHILPDIWAWDIQKGQNNSGFAAHRDLNERHLDKNGHPSFITLWVNLTETTPFNSCIYVLPTHLDPFYPDHLSEFPNNKENYHGISFENIRALPAKAGSVFCWSVNTVHWGSRSTKHASDNRISLGFYLYRGDETPDESLTFKDKLPFDSRLNCIGENILDYQNRLKFTDLTLAFANSVAKKRNWKLG